MHKMAIIPICRVHTQQKLIRLKIHLCYLTSEDCKTTLSKHKHKISKVQRSNNKFRDEKQRHTMHAAAFVMTISIRHITTPRCRQNKSRIAETNTPQHQVVCRVENHNSTNEHRKPNFYGNVAKNKRQESASHENQGPDYKKILRLSYDVIITYDNRKSNLR